MAILEIIENAKNLLSKTEVRAKAFDYKSMEHDHLMFQVENINNFIIEAESCLLVPGVKDKLDYREDIAYYHERFYCDTSASAYKFLKIIEKDVRNTFLWAKKLSWFGDWDFNFDGRHTLMSIVFANDAAINDYEIPHYFFHNAGKLTSKNFKLEIKSSESNLKSLSWINFSEDWETIEFHLEEKEEVIAIKGKAFKWDKAKFAGMTFDRPFYAERTTEYFGKDHIIYNQLDSQN